MALGNISSTSGDWALHHTHSQSGILRRLVWGLSGDSHGIGVMAFSGYLCFRARSPVKHKTPRKRGRPSPQISLRLLGPIASNLRAFVLLLVRLTPQFLRLYPRPQAFQLGLGPTAGPSKR